VTLKALDLQLSKYKALQELVASISLGKNGTFSSTEGFLQPTQNILETLFDLYLVLLCKTAGNDEKRQMLRQVIGFERADRLLEVLTAIE
jgi:hypothetical protein